MKQKLVSFGLGLALGLAVLLFAKFAPAAECVRNPDQVRAEGWPMWTRHMPGHKGEVCYYPEGHLAQYKQRQEPSRAVAEVPPPPPDVTDRIARVVRTLPPAVSFPVKASEWGDRWAPVAAGNQTSAMRDLQGRLVRQIHL